MARKPCTRLRTGESMTVAGTEAREEVAKVWATTARAVRGHSIITGTLRRGVGTLLRNFAH